MTEESMTYKMYFNTNCVPAEMVEKEDEWAEARELADGLFGLSAPNKCDPMNLPQRRKLVDMFADKPKVLIATWDTYDGSRKGCNFDGTNMLEHFKEKLNFDAQDVYMWDRGGECLTCDQLNKLQEDGFQPVYVNLRGWTTEHLQEDDIKASLDHPMCKGCVVEGSPEAFTKPILRRNERLQVAQYAADLGKPLFFLLWPGKRTALQLEGHADHLQNIRNMLESLHGCLDGHTRPDQVTFIVCAPGEEDNVLPFVPARNEDGEIANSVTGGMLLIGQHKEGGGW